MSAPDRIWIAPTQRSNGIDDFYLLNPKYRGNRGTEFVRADIVQELVEALEFYADRQYDGYDVAVTDYGLSTEGGPIIKDAGDKARAALDKLQKAK